MRPIEKAAVPVIVIAGGLVYIAEQFKQPSLIPIAIGLFGLFALWLGADTFARGEIRAFDRFYNSRESYAGISARLLAIIIFLFGGGLTIFAAWEWLRPGEGARFLANLAATKQGLGIAIAVFGVFTLLFGLVRLIAGSAWKKEERTTLDEIGFRVRGFIGVIVGLVLIGGGLWLVLP